MILRLQLNIEVDTQTQEARVVNTATAPLRACPGPCGGRPVRMGRRHCGVQCANAMKRIGTDAGANIMSAAERSCR